jgi:D-alanine-D-alanine ligase
LAALDPKKYEVIQIGITHEGQWLMDGDVIGAFEGGQYQSLTAVTFLPDPTRMGLWILRQIEGRDSIELASEIDVFFPVLHGSYGEDGTIQGLFELAGVAYVGAGVLGSSLGMDKGVFKDVMRANQIPVVDGQVILRRNLSANMEKTIDILESIAPYPLFTKPANMGSSVGVTKCWNRSDLLEGVMEAARFDRRILVERGINAREIEISVLGNSEPRASVPGEIIPAAEFYSYQAKYHNEHSELFIPAELPQDVSEQIRKLAIKAYQAIDCAGMARVDFLLDKESGEYYLNEVNTIPGFTKISMYPKLWEASGLDYPSLIDELINLALERKTEREKSEFRYSDPKKL